MPEIQLVSDAASNWGGWSGSVLEIDRVWPGTSKRAAAASSVAGCPAERRTSIDPRNSATLTRRSTTTTSNTVPFAVIDPTDRQSNMYGKSVYVGVVIGFR